MQKKVFQVMQFELCFHKKHSCSSCRHAQVRRQQTSQEHQPLAGYFDFIFFCQLLNKADKTVFVILQSFTILNYFSSLSLSPIFLSPFFFLKKTKPPKYLPVATQVLYKEGLGIGTPVPVTPEMERVKRNQENFSSVLLCNLRK